MLPNPSILQCPGSETSDRCTYRIERFAGVIRHGKISYATIVKSLKVRPLSSSSPRPCARSVCKNDKDNVGRSFDFDLRNFPRKERLSVFPNSTNHVDRAFIISLTFFRASSFFVAGHSLWIRKSDSFTLAPLLFDCSLSFRHELSLIGLERVIHKDPSTAKIPANQKHFTRKVSRGMAKFGRVIPGSPVHCWE